MARWPWLSLLVLLLLVEALVVASAAATARSQPARRVHAELVRVTPGDPGAADVTLSWTSFSNNQYADSASQVRVSAVGNHDAVTAYEAQVVVSGTANWTTLSQSISGTREAKRRADLHEKQRIFTRADAGEAITDGFFRLALAHAGVSDLDIHQRSVTPAIAFDASEGAMKAAIESLDVVSSVQVFRTASSTTAGAFEWTILFDPTTALDRGDLPLLILYTETISAAWTGPGDQVAIQSEREAALDHVVCASACVFDAMRLPTGQALAFRVRAHYTHMGWSEWSETSAPLRIPRTCALMLRDEV